MPKPLLDHAAKAHLLNVLTERHAGGLHGENVTLDAVRIGENITAKVTLESVDRTFVYAMEAAVLRDRYPGMSVEDAIDVCVDFIDWYMGEFFREHRELLLPIDWQPHRFGDVEVMARGELRNALLDDAADAWLRGERPDIAAQWKAIRRTKH